MTTFSTLVTVAAAGTPVALTLPTGQSGGLFSRMRIVPHSANTGRVVIGTSALVVATPIGIIDFLGAPSGVAAIDEFELEDSSGANSIDPTTFKIDVIVSGERAWVTLWQS